MNWDPSGAARIVLTFDPEGLTWAQRDGEACVVCHKKWPRPRIRVGRLPDSATVLACPDCAEALCPPTAGDVVVSFPTRRRRAAVH
ncbi:Fe-S-cluster-containing hydrogenase component 2 [Thermocatellispora tengchongensis]|uniref:Fe-S-cluster-containing hydrogenase component 2 n=1 Tax=Thermocatellispora tengchongensis TaxID=1073253 RepID=A0A840P1R1_9ACTN|nr:hypothetical protein [Thermocatellispora tengchongensis]MBB5133302.1 Fe-S-cluster-containing hydrogenase component 2 [Thermocatellispora tengchongensis]